MSRNNRGQVLVFVALAIVVILGLAALGIDLGYMYSVRHELQRSADAGALAGASAFTTGDWNESDVKGIAEARAREFAAKDKVVQATLNPDSEVAVSFPRYDHIEVVTSRNADLFFARIFGMGNKLITARAVARAEVTDIETDCIKPFAIPKPWVDLPGTAVQGKNTITTDPNGVWDQGEEVKDPSYGTRMTIKVGGKNTDNTAPSAQQTPGQFFIIQGNVPTIDYPDVTNWQGSSNYEEYIKKGCFKAVLGAPLDLMPGDRMGPTDKAVQTLIDGDPANTWPDTAEKPESLGPPRVIRVAMYDPSKFPVSGGGGQTGGSGTTAQVLPGYEIVGFWLEKVCGANDAGKSADCPKGADKGSVIGRYLGVMGDGKSSGNDPKNPTGTEVKKIALVE